MSRWILSLSLALAACAGTLDNPSSFRSRPAPGSQAAESTSPSCPDVVATVLSSPAHCAGAGCHSAADHAANLDLVSPGLASRLVGVPGTTREPLVDPDAPEKSLLDVMLGPSAASRMPLGAPPLDDATLACVLAWTKSLSSPTDAGTDVASPLPLPVPSEAGAAPTVAIRVAAGATAPYTDPDGNAWTKDTGFTGGSGTVSAAPIPIGGTNAAPLYNEERYGGDETTPAAFHYAFDVPPGAYDVTLKFAETLIAAPGGRRFDVEVNGQAALTDFDIFAAAGAKNTAVDRTVAATVGADGKITIDFVPGAAFNPKVCAIAILPHHEGR